MTIETEVAALTAATTALLGAVNIAKATLDAKVSDASTQAGNALASASAAGASQAAAAASAALAATIRFTATKALATTAAASLPDDTIIEVAADESLSGARTRYKVAAGALVFVYGVATQAELDAVAAAKVDKVAGVTFVEEHGTVGGAANDNALFVAAAAAGNMVLALGAEYKLDQLVFTSPVTIIFGPNTIVRNVQPSGVKKPAIRFTGGLTGTAVAIAQIGAGTGEHTDSITVADASQFAAGDTLYIKENEALRAEVNNPASSQDFNYWQFGTVNSIVGNVITFKEFLRFPFDTVDAPTVQKVSFLENCHVSGGIHTGGNGGGGGVGFEFCRNSSAKQIAGVGNSEADRNGGPPVSFANCWECVSDDTRGKWALFGFYAYRNQSCIFDKIRAKRTQSAGVIDAGNIFCTFPAINLDSPGDNNGDGITQSNGSRHNVYGSYTISGARCYGMWQHESCDDNVFEAFKAVSGITGGAYLYGSRNRFNSFVVKGNPSFGLGIYGTGNYAVVDIDVKGAAVTFGGTIGTPGSGNRIVGTAISRGSDSLSRDVLISANVTDTVIDVIGGSRGLSYGGSAVEQHSNDIVVRGPTPYSLRKLQCTRGFRWSGIINSLTDVPQPIMVPGSGTNGLTQLVSTGTDTNGKIYKITLKLASGLADTWSEYLMIARSGTWYKEIIHEGAGTYAIYVPKLTVNGAGLEVSKVHDSAINVLVMIEQF